MYKCNNLERDLIPVSALREQMFMHTLCQLHLLYHPEGVARIEEHVLMKRIRENAFSLKNKCSRCRFVQERNLSSVNLISSQHCEEKEGVFLSDDLNNIREVLKMYFAVSAFPL